jgi:tetratricopeptide (TPR) repeat protein
MSDVDQDLAELDAEIAREADSGEPEAEQRLAHAMLQKGARLRAAGRLEDAVRSLDELVDRLSDTDDEEVRRDVVRGLQYKGYALEGLGRVDEAAAAFGQAAELGGDFAKPSPDAMRDMYEQACSLTNDGRHPEALLVLADLINPWPDGPPEDVLDIVVVAMLDAAELAGTVGENPGASLELYDEVIRRYGDRTDPWVRASVASAMLGRAEALGGTAGPEAAIRACTEVLAYLGEAADPEGKVQIAAALNDRAFWLAGAGRGEAAAAD